MADKKPDKSEQPKEPEKKSEEEVSLDGAHPASADAPTTPDGVEVPVVTFQRHETTDMQEQITPGMSDEQILDAIIEAPQEKTLPWEQVELPSKGIYYNWTTGIIDVRPWGIQVDKILATDRMTQSGQAIDYVLRDCCRFPDGFDPVDLLVGDQIFLLYYLRGITHGNMYEFATKNPSNGTLNTYTFNMNDLAGTIAYANPSLGTEPFQIRLPHLSQKTGRDFHVGVRLLRVRDTHSIARNQKAISRNVASNTARVKQRKQQASSLAARRAAGKGGQQPTASMAKNQAIPVDDTLTKNLEVIIVEAMGKPDRMKIRRLVERFHATDSATIREWLAENSPGIDTTVELTDSESGEIFQVALPITETFFRPQES